MVSLITEIYNDDCQTLTESTDDGKKNYFIEGPFMQAEIPNGNGRSYPLAVLEKELSRYNKDFIQTKRAIGELGHPAGPQINGDRVSHLICEMKANGNDFIGKAKILDTPMGKIVKTFIDEGIKIGVSTRGLGSVKATSNGIMEVQNDFHLVTIDVVTNPSGPNCFVNGIMENTEYYYDIASRNWRIAEKLEETVKELKKEYAPSKPKMDERKAMRIFESFIRSL
jgi:hypothetical protein